MAGVRQPVLVPFTVFLASCVLAHCSATVRIAYNTTGTSTLTPAALPLPPGSA